jgi:hypothetical protein
MWDRRARRSSSYPTIEPSRVPPWTIFTETLIHDFDALRYLNPGAEPAEVYAVADALVRPDFKDRGLLDTAVVVMRFSNGAIATAEASFQAVYGYDIRGEVFGSVGLVTAGDVRRTSATYYGAQGVAADTWRRNIDLFHDAYVAQLAAFAGSVRTGVTAGPPARTPAPPWPRSARSRPAAPCTSARSTPLPRQGGRRRIPRLEPRPFGNLPGDKARLTDELSRRGPRVTGGRRSPRRETQTKHKAPCFHRGEIRQRIPRNPRCRAYVAEQQKRPG